MSMNDNQTKWGHQKTRGAREHSKDLCLNLRNSKFTSVLFLHKFRYNFGKIQGLGGSERLSIDPKETWRLSCANWGYFSCLGMLLGFSPCNFGYLSVVLFVLDIKD